MKVNKRKLGQGLRFTFPKNHSVLVNLKTGGLRTIPGCNKVTVLTENLTLRKADNPKDYIKEKWVDMGWRPSRYNRT